MRTKCLAIIVCFTLLVLRYGSAETLATIDFLDGPVDVARDGAILPQVGIGDEILDGDLVTTGSAGRATLKLAPSTGMSGTIAISQKSSFYFNSANIKGSKSGQAELIAGQIGLKLKRLAGSSTFGVETESASCAVRGTEFDVIASPDGAILVACSEGEVACSSEGVSASAIPGQAVEKREGAALARRAFAQAEYESFKAKWLGDELAAFQRDAPRAAKRISGRYLELSERLAANHEKIAASGALRAWVAEEKSRSKRPVARREIERRLAEIEPLLKESRSILATMERVAARVDSLKEAIGDDPAVLGQEIRPGRTIGDFFARFSDAKARDLQRVAVLRRAIRFAKNASE